MKKLSITIITLMISTLAFSQSKAGDKLFDNFLYSEALYEYEGVKNKNEATVRRMAEAYMKTSDPYEAAIYYEKLFSMGTVTAEDVWNYAEALKMNQKYAEAMQKIQQYESMKPGERRTALHLADPLYFDKLLSDNERFAVKQLEFNDQENDYAPTWYNAHLVFVSTRPIYTFTATHDGWTDKRFTNLFAGYDATTRKGAPTIDKIRDVKIRGKLSKKFHEGPASFSADGHTMIFSRNSYKKKKELGTGGDRKIELWMSKMDVDGTWRNAVPLPFNSLEYNVGHPSISADGKTLYFISDMPGGYGGTDIYRCSMTSDGVFGTPVNMGDKINTEGDEMYPFIHEENVLFFASNGHAGLGGLDIFCTKLKENGKGRIMNLGGSINSSMDDFGLIMDISMKRGFFSSNRQSGKGGDDIYGFDVLKPFLFNKSVAGVVYDKETDLGLANVKVELKDSAGNVLHTTTTSADGSYTFEVSPNIKFQVVANSDGYTEASKTSSSLTEEDIITVDLNMDKMLSIAVACTVTDKNSGKPLDSTHVVIINRDTERILFEGYTDAVGNWRHSLEKTLMNTTINYTIKLDRNGYVPKTIEWSYRVYKEEVIKMSNFMDFSLGTLAIGVDLAKVLGLKPIYFDLGKSDIRPDAAIELEKIVTCMKLYPNIIIELDSHTDCRNSADANRILSQKRADASVEYIVSKGIARERISGRGMGEDKPVNGCICEGTVKSTCTEEEHALNRRTEFLIVDIK